LRKLRRSLDMLLIYPPSQRTPTELELGPVEAKRGYLDIRGRVNSRFNFGREVNMPGKGLSSVNLDEAVIAFLRRILDIQLN
jgi:hypothetical protein